MKTRLTVLLVGLLVSGCVDAQINSGPSPNASKPTVETIVCIRHGEKPSGGLGQLTCRGLNRALALADVLPAKYGQPQFVFAPSPTQKVDGHTSYYYVRPLMTIEPTAIRCGLPVNAQFGYREIEGLERELQKQQYQKATIFIAWEHALLDDFVKHLVVANGGDAAQVPSWPADDYDSIFLVRIIRSSGGQSVAFTIDHEGLNNLPDACPQIAHP
ncbi:conserved exported hypothetical protein [Syntrophobacter sp. SbD1]|nr:conserved exported hypothetical protein [Syntrophobacter sp. SbD1]